MMRILLVVVALFAVVEAVTARYMRQEHECPAYECDASAGSGCQPGYTCTPINCGDVCIPFVKDNTDTN